MIKPFYLRLLIASILSFSCGWIDVLGIVRFKLFFAMCTGNLIYFGLSISPDPIRLAAGVDKSPFLYLCIILCNTLGCFTYHYWCINKRQRPLSFSLEGFRLGPGMCVALITTIPGIIVFVIQSSYSSLDVSRSPWFGLLLAPCFGAMNAMTIESPLNCSAILMTGNLQQLCKHAVEYIETGGRIGHYNHHAFELGAIMPLFSLAGAASFAGMLWLNDGQFYTSYWASIPPFFMVVITFILYDYLSKYMVKEEQEQVQEHEHEQTVTASIILRLGD